jgi:hypothetical protein
MKHLGFTYFDLNKLEIRYRRWFIERLVKDYSKKDEADNQNISKNMKNLNAYQEMLNKKI